MKFTKVSWQQSPGGLLTDDKGILGIQKSDAETICHSDLV
jgi:hypothetical protein